jgi:hypothetical protein
VDEDDDRVLTADELFCYLVFPRRKRINTRENVDILGIPITSPYMTASGILYFMRFQYLLRTRGNAKSLYPGQADTNAKGYIEHVMKNTDTGTLTRDLCEVGAAKGLRPGDIITTVESGYGHAVGVLQILQIEGARDVKLFAGSYPASSVRIYPYLVTPGQLDRLSKEGYLFFRRWCD